MTVEEYKSKAQEISDSMPDVLVKLTKEECYNDSLIQIRKMMGERDVAWKKVRCFLACCELEMDDDVIAALETVLTEYGFEENPIDKATWDQGLRVVFLACGIKAGVDHENMECYREGHWQYEERLHEGAAVSTSL
eukprot:TRINITY_DN12284_c0_g1_i1.p2 TRINITY_DN12284_c0_g1~~TRINITY_DN12284_c0_g1_i1.p2  ORF type:complete len:136 (+),score=34.29 TRINITY_DN12284_c0_g1_i1:449-856(+)